MKLKVPFYISTAVLLFGFILTCTALDKENTSHNLIDESLIEYKDFPKPGVDFYDVSGVLRNPKALKAVIDNLASHYKDKKIEAILAVDSRGFLFATPLAYKLNIPVIMVRKPGKLPGKTIRAEFTKEYGKDAMEMQQDALQPGQRVIIIDDLIATGGTFKAAIDLARQAHAEVVEVTAIVELSKFKDTRNLDVALYSVVKK